MIKEKRLQLIKEIQSDLDELKSIDPFSCANDDSAIARRCMKNTKKLYKGICRFLEEAYKDRQKRIDLCLKVYKGSTTSYLPVIKNCSTPSREA